MPALYFTPSSAIDYISHQERFLLDSMFLLRNTDRIRNVCQHRYLANVYANLLPPYEHCPNFISFIEKFIHYKWLQRVGSISGDF